MINTTVTIEESFQVLDPIAVTPPGTDPKTYLESGYTNLTSGQQTKVITFTVAKIAVYDFVELEIVNVTDATPINFSFEITAKSLTGFTITLSGLPDTANYYLQWTVQVPPQ